MTISQHLSTRIKVPMIVLLCWSILCCPASLDAQDCSAIERKEEQDSDSVNESVEKENRDANADKQVKQKLFWLFLNSGRSLDSLESEKVQAMQHGHLQNLNRLAEEGILLSAGSVTDPAESMQGIAIVTAEMNPVQMFKDDELVNRGFAKFRLRR